MTPHEKAKDIYQKMFDNMPHPNETNAAVFLITKQCALIAVDEILKGIVPKNDDERYAFELNGNQFYWEEVKKEIETL
jgi:hypothetical protein